MRLRAWVRVTVATAMAAAVVTLPLDTAPSASAHAGEQPLLVEPHSTWPGGTVMVRGDLPVTSDVHLLLVDASGRMTQVARVDDPPSGHFDVPVTVPASTRLGAWSIVAVAGGDAVGRVALTVGAAPPVVGERPDQAEPLLAPGAVPPAVPPPAGAQAAGSSADQTGAAARQAVPAPAPSGPASTTGSAPAWFAVGLGLAALAAYVVLRQRLPVRTRPSGPDHVGWPFRSGADGPNRS